MNAKEQLQYGAESELPTLGRNAVLSWSLALVAACAYFGFLLSCAIAPQLLGRPALGKIPWSFLLSSGLLIGVVILTGVYVLVTNRREDR